jgi:hypothetical protein
MIELQETIAKAQSATVGLRRGLVDHATKEYFSVLDLVRSPSTADFQAAEARAYAVLKQEILAVGAVALVRGGTDSRRRGGKLGPAEAEAEERGLALVALGFEAIAPALRIPGPAVLTEPKTLLLAMAGAAGALGGMFALAPLMRWAFQMQDLGLVLGGPLGALLAVLIAQRLARVRLLARILPWIFVRPRALRGAVRSDHEKAVRACIEQWVDWAVPLLTVLCLQESGAAKTRTDRDKALRRIGKLIYALHRTGPESLPVVAHELIQEAKNSGFEDLEGLPAFVEKAKMEKETLVWKPDLQGRYETFGHIVEGDQVQVERPAVIFGGQVVQRGLVRKVRERT